MDKEMFWEVIREVNNRVDENDQQAVLEATRKKLMEFSAADIVIWHQIKGEYMDIAHRNDLWAACAATGTHYSDDGFVDFCSWLISKGREVYMQALKDPDSLADVEIPAEGADFEAYGYVSIYAYAQKKEVEKIGLEGILEDYWAWIGKNRKINAEAYLWTLKEKNNIYREMDAHPLRETEKRDIWAELGRRPDITVDWNLEMLPEILPRLYAKYRIGQGMDMA